MLAKPQRAHSIARPASQFLPKELKTYAEALAQYHLRPEAKFLNGDFCDRGRTERRHGIATQLVHIGKEANKWEEQHFLGEDEDAEIEYGIAENTVFLDAGIRRLCEEFGEKAAAQRIWDFADGIAPSTEARSGRHVSVDAGKASQNSEDANS